MGKLVKLGDFSTLTEVVLNNTGKKSIEDLNGKKYYYVKNVKEVAKRIKEAVQEKKKIFVFGDYDADGITATAIMVKSIKSLGGIVEWETPTRPDGFGLSLKAVDHAINLNCDILITVDNGITAVDQVAYAKEKGLEVIVTDHHLPREDGKLPETNLIVNAHLPGSDYTEYCGAGIAYLIARELISEDKTLLAKLSCFAAIGTVADVVCLLEENRQIVIEGLKNMVSYGKRTTGLYAILKAAGFDYRITAHDIAFSIGPMFNAPGRLLADGAKEVVEAILYDGAYNKRAEEIGEKMVEYNEKRKKLAAECMQATYRNISDNCLFTDYPLIIYEPSIPEGMVGLIAGRIAEERKVPTIIMTNDSEEGILKGSGRTECGVHLKNLLDICKDKLVKYGGHAEACGLSLKEEDFDDFVTLMQENVPEKVINADDNVYYQYKAKISEIDALLEELEKLEPFGEGNPRPIVYIEDFQLSPRTGASYKILGENGDHIKLFGNNLDAIVFNAAQKYIDMKEPSKLNIVGTLSRKYFMGHYANQIEVSYMEASKNVVGKTLLAQKLEAMAKKRNL